MYRDYVILAITLLIIALIFAGIRVRKYNWPYLYYLAGIVISAFMFTDPALVGNRFVNILYPLFVPFLYIIGPGVYGSVQPVEVRRNPWHIIHYLPMIVGYTIIFLHWFLDEPGYRQSVFNGRQFDFEHNKMFWPFSDTFIFLGYPIYSTWYYLLTLRKLREYKAPTKQYILPVALIASTPIIIDVVHHFVVGHGLLIQNDEILRYLLLGTIVVIFWDVIIVKPPKPAEVTEIHEVTMERSLTYPGIDEVRNESLALYLSDICEEWHEAVHLKTKQAFIKHSPYSAKDWEDFFFDSKTNWNYLKKFIRIKRALNLMEDGYLIHSNVEELASEIGYSTRASLYLAFKQVMGITLPEYRLEKEI